MREGGWRREDGGGGMEKGGWRRRDGVEMGEEGGDEGGRMGDSGCRRKGL